MVLPARSRSRMGAATLSHVTRVAQYGVPGVAVAMLSSVLQSQRAIDVMRALDDDLFDLVVTIFLGREFSQEPVKIGSGDFQIFNLFTDQLKQGGVSFLMRRTRLIEPL